MLVSFDRLTSRQVNTEVLVLNWQQQSLPVPWTAVDTELDGDGTREVDQVSYRKSTVAIYEVFWYDNCDASCFGKYIPRPKCLQKRGNVEGNVSKFKYSIHGAPGILLSYMCHIYNIHIHKMISFSVLVKTNVFISNVSK